jgi:hypothetical protein
MAKTIYVDEQASEPAEMITLEVEELEEVIAPASTIRR